MSHGPITPDGSPVDFYLQLSPGDDEAALVASAAPHGGSVLELGCGVGRVTHPLVARGLDVVAVDEAAEMLSHVRGAVRVCARIESLHLAGRFDVVLLGSQLANEPDDDRLLAMLATCAEHLGPGGCLVVEWTTAEAMGAWSVSGVPDGPEPSSTLTWLERVAPDLVDAEVTYRAGERAWRQRFRARARSEAALDALLGRAGLRLDRRLTDDGRWLTVRGC